MSSSDKRFKKTVELTFPSEKEKHDFSVKWFALRKQHPSLKTNLQIMYFFLSLAARYASPETVKTEHNEDDFHYNSFVNISVERAKEERMFVCCETAIDSLVNAVYKLGQISRYSKAAVTVKLEQFSNYVASFTISNHLHSFIWKSSPYIQGWSSFLVNEKMSFAVICSGVMYEPFVRFVIAAQLGSPYRNFLYDTLSRIAPFIDLEADLSRHTAIHESAVMNGEKGITMETDERYSTLGNGSRSVTLGLCNDTHKVLADKATTKTEDLVLQVHEAVSTKKVLADFKDKKIPIRCIVFHSKTRLGEVLKDDSPSVKEQKDVSHAITEDLSGFHKICKGPLKMENISWSSQLSDKYEGLKKHFWYSIMDSGKDINILRDSLDAIVLHYEGDHENCRLSSPCVQNPKYQSTRVLLTDPVATKLLSDFIQSTSIYKNPSVVLEGLTAGYVQAANTSIRSFLPQRQGFSEVEFDARVKLFILYWNENVRKPSTVVKLEPGVAVNEKSSLKNTSQKTYVYCTKIWHRYLTESKLE